MVKKLTLCAGIAGAFCMPASIALAQDGGMVYTLDISQRLETTENLDLSTPSEGTTSQAVTHLSFGLSSETRTQMFKLQAGTALRFTDAPDGSDVKFDDPSLNFSYSREAANASFSTSAQYRRTDVDYARAFDLIVDDDGTITLPDDFDDLTGSGTREDYGARIGLELGTNAPLGFSFTAGLKVLEYSDVTDPDLFDTERRDYSAAANLRFSEATQGTVRLRRDEFQDEDPAGQTDRETTSLSFGITHALSPSVEMEASIGHSWIDTDETVGAVTTSSSVEGLNGQLELAFDRPNGELSTAIGAITNQDGQRYNASIGRRIDLKDGSLSAELGLTKPEDDDTDVTGGLSWFKELPNGALNARLKRAIRPNSGDEDVLTTSLFLGYRYDINSVSGLNFNASYANTEEGSTDTRQTQLSASYRHALTSDWDLNVGLTHRERDETAQPSATSNSLFLTLSRQFAWQQ